MTFFIGDFEATPQNLRSGIFRYKKLKSVGAGNEN